MDRDLLILIVKILAQWTVSTGWSKESPELYNRAVVVNLLKFLTTDGNEFEEAQQIFVQCCLALILTEHGTRLKACCKLLHKLSHRLSAAKPRGKVGKASLDNGLRS
jgi:hypothetical protein